MFFEKILNYNYEILLIDAIYKMNKYKISLIIISGVTPLNISYYISFVFISKETYEMNKWLFECIKNFYKYLNIPDLNFILTDTQNFLI